MPNEIPYKSFCWALGTTSFRTKDFNKTIEEQLALLNEFWELPENQNANWSGDNDTQTRYYDFMKEKEFVVGSANNKPKDAREKTSGLVDIGIIDGNRKLTEAGTKLLEISLSNDFTTDNFFQIPRDSFLYLRQLLKTYNNVDGTVVRPFIVLLYVLSKVGYLSSEEFTYLLPLCTSDEYTEQIIDGIRANRNHSVSVDDIIINRLLEMDNYQAALDKFLSNTVTENLICEVGLNRKSRNYDKPYLRLYNELYSVFIENDSSRLPFVYSATKRINIGKWWRKYLFNTASERAIGRNPVVCLKQTAFSDVSNEHQFKKAFFKIMHLFKAKATLSDYLDLNRRYIRTTDIVLFEDGTVKLDILPKHFFNSVADELYAYAYIPCEILFEDSSLEEIADCLVINEETVIDGVNAELGINVTNIDEARNALEDERYRRLQHLIDTKFSDENIITLLGYFEDRNDTEIKNMVTENADIPTIFEYVLGIFWYKISERQGKILDYMKLSLDADLLPKTHAAGGEADIVYEYQETEYYPAHSLLIEATLADSTNQRRMEMEPVSRHLGRHLLRTGNLNSYCVFATTYLDINVIADFRGRKNMPFYDTQDYNRSVDGMKIIPLQTSEIKRIVNDDKKYCELYQIFKVAYDSELPPHNWYEESIVQKV
ncbi:AlwI family type II restriction endonuclease [Ruminococcus sp.]|uniref:AlwI family type II restriction endonuclease n=1 Tax=Ruminococcus sp. TaxID=41978 RepID=UPI00261DAA22|nr:AlwI family type II restriction endonuclease [Ruminococcus sp.]MDD6989190.1 AlwI family type II restriction endonuclease [Ruminococcus sp.]MDY6201638.1 AlwI family type II restriction endonuclease [Ruminococcus sp.]